VLIRSPLTSALPPSVYIAARVLMAILELPDHAQWEILDSLFRNRHLVEMAEAVHGRIDGPC
jgi:hypothetical protein